MKRFLPLFLLLAGLCRMAAAQTTDTMTFALNEYLTIKCKSPDPYPQLRLNMVSGPAMDTGNMVKVTAFGAVGDSTTDDWAAIQKAFDTCTARQARGLNVSGVMFPAGKTFLTSKMWEVEVGIGKTLKVWQAGNIKLKALANTYNVINIMCKCADTVRSGKVVWVGINNAWIDGNQQNLTWPGNAKGGIYDDSFLLDHGVMVQVDSALFACFHNVKIKNPVVDGISVRKSFIYIVNASRADNGAPLHYGTVDEQGTYFKVTRKGYVYGYFTNDTCYGGSIGIQASHQEGLPLDVNTTTVVNHCEFSGQTQNSLHVEDCYNTAFANSIIDQTPRTDVAPRVLFSNRCGRVIVKNVNGHNTALNFSNASSLLTGMVIGCNFSSDIPYGQGFKTLAQFISGGKVSVSGCSFNGRTDTTLITADFVRTSSFSNYGTQYAIRTAQLVDSCQFTNATKAISFKNGYSTQGFHNVFTNISSPNTNYTPSNPDYILPFKKSIVVRSHLRRLLGRIAAAVFGTN